MKFIESFLEPVLFNIFINDIVGLSRKTLLYLFQAAVHLIMPLKKKNAYCSFKKKSLSLNFTVSF